MTQTSAPVQLDQVLTALQSDARSDLQQLLDNYGQALKHHPDAGGDPHEFRKVQWAIEVLRRYRPPDS